MARGSAGSKTRVMFYCPTDPGYRDTARMLVEVRYAYTHTRVHECVHPPLPPLALSLALPHPMPVRVRVRAHESIASPGHLPSFCLSHLTYIVAIVLRVVVVARRAWYWRCKGAR